jgi:hypothetical protein
MKKEVINVKPVPNDRYNCIEGYEKQAAITITIECVRLTLLGAQHHCIYI